MSLRAKGGRRCKISSSSGGGRRRWGSLRGRDKFIKPYLVVDSDYTGEDDANREDRSLREKGQ
jgi:hypothetical protein